MVRAKKFAFMIVLAGLGAAAGLWLGKGSSLQAQDGGSVQGFATCSLFTCDSITQVLWPYHSHGDPGCVCDLSEADGSVMSLLEG